MDTSLGGTSANKVLKHELKAATQISKVLTKVFFVVFCVFVSNQPARTKFNKQHSDDRPISEM